MAKKKVTEILIDLRRCKGCEICVAFCPTKVLALQEQKSRVVNLPACIACGLCEIRCPDFAIELVYQADKGAENG